MERLSRTLLSNLGFKADLLFFCKLCKFEVLRVFGVLDTESEVQKNDWDKEWDDD